MMKYRSILLLMLFLSLSGKVSAQFAKSEKIKPQWLHKQPKPSNTTFVYETDYATGKSLDEARTKSLNGLIAASGFENGVVVLSDYKSQTVDSKVYIGGKLSDYQVDAFESNSQVKGHEVRLHVKSVAEYWTRDINGTVNLTTLYAKSLNGTPNFDDVELTTKYGAHGLWRSAIVPGWGQFHKGANLKGGLILGGCASLGPELSLRKDNGLIMPEKSKKPTVPTSNVTMPPRGITLLRGAISVSVCWRRSMYTT